MKQITLDGRIGKGGAKIMKTAKGKDYVRFSLANDSFVNGQNKTEWFDVTCFDQYVVENKSKYLTQGRYAIVQGVLNSEVTNKNGTIYLNHYVSAVNIEHPSFGKKEETNEATVSTYTGGTKSEHTVPQAEPVQEAQQPVAQVQQPVVPQPQTVAAQPQGWTAMQAQAAPAGWADDSDLPF